MKFSSSILKTVFNVPTNTAIGSYQSDSKSRHSSECLNLHFKHFLQDSKCSELSKCCNGAALVSINKSAQGVSRVVLTLVVIWVLIFLKRYLKNFGGAMAASHWQNCYENVSVYIKHSSSWFLSLLGLGW